MSQTDNHNLLGLAERLQTVEEWANNPAPESADALIGFLDDDAGEVRKRASEALGQRQHTPALPHLVLRLVDTEAEVRKAAEAALQAMDPGWERSPSAQQALPALQVALQHDNYWVGLAAGAVINRICGENEVATAPPSAPATNNTSTALTDRFFHEHREAARLLASSLKDSDPDLRMAAAEALGRLGSVGFVDALSASLTDTDEWVRWHTAQSLQKLGWQPTDTFQQALFLVSLRKWDDAVQLGTAALAPLTTALKCADIMVRTAAAQALGRIKDSRSVTPLAECLKDPHKSVRQAAAAALTAIGTHFLNLEQRQLLMTTMKG